jgi:hypothetical protein
MIIARHVPNADPVDADGLLEDIDVMDIDEPLKSRREQRSRDIDALFSAPYLNTSILESREEDLHQR